MLLSITFLTWEKSALTDAFKTVFKKYAIQTVKFIVKISLNI